MLLINQQLFFLSITKTIMPLDIVNVVAGFMMVFIVKT